MQSFKVEPPASPVTKKPATIQGLAMTEANQVYAWFSVQQRPGSPEPLVYGIYQLDRGKQAWVLVARESLERYMGLYGIDGDSLILRSGCCRYGWFAAPNIVP